MSGSFAKDRPEQGADARRDDNPAHPRPPSTGGQLLDLQRALGNEAVTRLVLQRLPLNESEQALLADMHDRSLAKHTQAAIEGMGVTEAGSWRAWIAKLDSDGVESAYGALGHTWERQGIAGVRAFLSTIPRVGPRPPMVASGQQRQQRPNRPAGAWSDLPDTDRTYLTDLWTDFGGKDPGKAPLQNYWRASPDKLGPDWRTAVQQPFPARPNEQNQDFRQFWQDMSGVSNTASKADAAWGSTPMEWIWRGAPSSQLCQLRIYLNAKARYAGKVLADFPKADFGDQVAAKAGAYDTVSRYRDCVVIYVSAKSLGDAEATAGKVYDWLREYQATRADYFANDIPVLTRPIDGLRGVGVGEDPPGQESFTQLRREIVQKALQQANGDEREFRRLVMQGFADNNIPARQPWKQSSSKQTYRQPTLT